MKTFTQNQLLHGAFALFCALCLLGPVAAAGESLLQGSSLCAAKTLTNSSALENITEGILMWEVRIALLASQQEGLRGPMCIPRKEALGTCIYRMRMQMNEIIDLHTILIREQRKPSICNGLETHIRNQVNERIKHLTQLKLLEHAHRNKSLHPQAGEALVLSWATAAYSATQENSEACIQKLCAFLNLFINDSMLGMAIC
ncbi:uncharacterized protein NEMAJ01_1708 [Nematocida major]|uniref:uncharacterized protein n=1 Tax=Nematocida major TaxID=1912982 RepID=UPI002008112E|nr:uncharacterized protein NEMAJ01_1708 [Nematocida major]KAH9386812.1 hypothetical protein NEMAJ01_1708 [Nematocida major]